MLSLRSWVLISSIVECCCFLVVNDLLVSFSPSKSLSSHKMRDNLHETHPKSSVKYIYLLHPSTRSLVVVVVYCLLFRGVSWWWWWPGWCCRATPRSLRLTWMARRLLPSHHQAAEGEKRRRSLLNKLPTYPRKNAFTLSLSSGVSSASRSSSCDDILYQ